MAIHSYALETTSEEISPDPGLGGCCILKHYSGVCTKTADRVWNVCTPYLYPDKITCTDYSNNILNLNCHPTGSTCPTGEAGRGKPCSQTDDQWISKKCKDIPDCDGLPTEGGSISAE